MSKNVAIIGANGQIARLVEQRILKEDSTIHLNLLLRNASRLNDLQGNSQVTIIPGDANNEGNLRKAIHGQDIVYVSFLDLGSGANLTKKVIKVMDKEGVKRLISSNVIGIYDEVPEPFGSYERNFTFGGKVTESSSFVQSDKAVEASDLDYTVLRIPWLNNRNDTKYKVTSKNERYVGVSVSRKAAADLIYRIIKDPSLYNKDSIGFADPDTDGLANPVY